MRRFPSLYTGKSAQPQSYWNIKALLFSHLIILLLLASLFLTNFWRPIDLAFFKLLNGTLHGPYWWKAFWALANTKWADLLEDVIIVFFFLLYILKGNRFSRPKRISEFLFCALYIAAIIFFFNRKLLQSHVHFYWPSPSVVVDSAVHLTQEIPWLTFKDHSFKSFPGDHASTALLFAGAYSHIARGKLALFASLYALFLCLPRLITGAHWLSDIVVGSGSVALFFLSWAFCSPLFHRSTIAIEKIVVSFSSFSKLKGRK